MITPQERMMTWLAHGVPLALLADLADPSGPRSREILTAEAVADDVRRDLELPRPVAGPRVVQEDFSAAQSA